MNSQLIQENDYPLVGSLPANHPVAYLYQQNGLYHYAGSCCVVVPHTGLIITTTKINDRDMGCGNAVPVSEYEELPPLAGGDYGAQPKYVLVASSAAEKRKNDSELGDPTVTTILAGRIGETEVDKVRFSYTEGKVSATTAAVLDKLEANKADKTFELKRVIHAGLKYPKGASSLNYLAASEIDRGDDDNPSTIDVVQAFQAGDLPVYWLLTSGQIPLRILVTTKP